MGVGGWRLIACRFFGSFLEGAFVGGGGGGGGGRFADAAF